MSPKNALPDEGQAKRERVLILGLDGATFDLIIPLAESEQLPNIARLMANGTHSELHSTIQPVTAPAWATILTGVNQGQHGLYDFVRRKPGTYSLQVTNGRDNKGMSIFELASQYNKQVMAINIPYTAPPRPVNGIVVGGPFIPDLTAEQVYPSSFYSKLNKIIPNYFVTAAYNAAAADPLGEYARQIEESIDIRTQLCSHLIKEEEWELFMVVFMEPDEVHHAYWHTLDAVDGTADAVYKDVIPATYRLLDKAIGDLLADAHSALGPDENLNVVVVSDHGAGPLHYMINLNQWLKEGGFLQFLSAPPYGIYGVRRKILTSLAALYKQYLPPAWRGYIRRHLGLDRFEKIKGDLESTLLMSKIDWRQTQAYALGAGGNIFINLAGREPEGTVTEGEEFERICQQVTNHLHTLSDPETGNALIKKVHRGTMLYSGSYVNRAPDLVIEWLDYGFWGRGRYDSNAPTFEKINSLEFSEQPLTGSHRPEGIFIAAGPAIKTASVPTSPQLVDIAPTILTLLGIETPQNMDGRLLHEIFVNGDALFSNKTLSETQSIDEQRLTDNETRAKDSVTLSDDDSEKIAERLRSLGYL